jgi:hypothetical protein
MLRKIETSCSATAFVDNDPVTALAGPSDELRLFEEWSPSEGDSFFYIAMGISDPRVRACRRDRIR